jgi:hypothetical protein
VVWVVAMVVVCVVPGTARGIAVALVAVVARRWGVSGRWVGWCVVVEEVA